MADRLRIIQRKHFSKYKERQPITISKHIASLERRLCTPQDFRFYLIASSCNSSMIEGSNLDTETYFRLKEAGFVSKGLREVEDIVKTYDFASTHVLNEANLLKAHKSISAHLDIPKKYMGVLRDRPVNVWGNGKIVYKCADTKIVSREMQKLFHDIQLLKERKLSTDEVFYYASMIHLVFVSIHPFADGNGRMARLLEKWFLAEKLGMVAWRIQSEKLYYKRKRSYYSRLHFRTDYKTIDYSRGVDFLTLLPMALNIK